MKLQKELTSFLELNFPLELGKVQFIGKQDWTFLTAFNHALVLSQKSMNEMIQPLKNCSVATVQNWTTTTTLLVQIGSSTVTYPSIFP